MDFLDSVGIILRKSNASQYKIVVLDKIQGKIECVTLASTLSVGALITYTIKQQRMNYIMRDDALLYIPLSLAQVDVLFFHHILELIYQFMYAGVCPGEVFDLLAFLYAMDHFTMTLQSKKLFLLKLFSGMGIIPEINGAHMKHIIALTMIDARQVIMMTIDAQFERALDRWLWYCVWQHPCANEFKTIHFLVNNRAL